MSVATARNLLDNVRQFHQQVADYCQRVALHQNERIRMLLEYIGRHEQHLAEATAAYQQDGLDKVLNTWFRNVPTQLASAKDIDTLGNHPSVDDVINWVVRLDDSVINYYQSLAEEAEIPEMRTALTNLLAMESREKLKTVRSALRINDL